MSKVRVALAVMVALMTLAMAPAAGLAVARTIDPINSARGTPEPMVTVTASGHQDVAIVWIGDLDAVFSVDSSTQLKMTVPTVRVSGTTGVHTPDGTTRCDEAFQVVPQLSGAGSAPTGSSVTLSGAGFGPATPVELWLGAQPVIVGADDGVLRACLPGPLVP